MIEVYGRIGAIEGLDSALKAANVSLVNMVRVGGGLTSVFVEGDVGAVKASIDAAASAAERVGKLMSAHVIPRPDEAVRKMLDISLNEEFNGGPGGGNEEKPAQPKEAKTAEVKKVEAVKEVEPKKAEAKKEEPKKAEPKKEEPKKAEAKKEDTKKAEVKKADTKKVEATKKEAVKKVDSAEKAKKDTKAQPKEAAKAASVGKSEFVGTAKKESKKDAKPEAKKVDESNLESLTVGELRKVAREIKDFPLSREEIKFAKKEELLEAMSPKK